MWAIMAVVASRGPGAARVFVPVRASSGGAGLRVPIARPRKSVHLANRRTATSGGTPARIADVYYRIYSMFKGNKAIMSPPMNTPSRVTTAIKQRTRTLY